MKPLFRVLGELKLLPAFSESTITDCADFNTILSVANSMNPIRVDFKPCTINCPETHILISRGWVLLLTESKARQVHSNFNPILCLDKCLESEDIQ